MSFLEVHNVSKTYPRANTACISGLDLAAEKGEIIAVLGESGCGKTTLLKLVAGLESPDSGRIVIDGEKMGKRPAEKRPISMVFQKALLFGNMTVGQNVNFAPRLKRSMDQKSLAQKTEEMLALVHMEGFGKRKTTELSGGQEQRVSLARALMTEPKVLLLDEPLSALDANLKPTMQEMIVELQEKLGTTMLYVTHDQNEASCVADRIALMHEGKIIQMDAPDTFYTRPVNRYAAEFFGWKNFLPGTKSGGKAECCLGNIPLRRTDFSDGRILLCIRPEAAVNIGSGGLSGKVISKNPRALEVLYTLDCGGEKLILSVRSAQKLEVGEELRFDLDPNGVWAVECDADS